ncbi:hypothetical protein [Aurantimonas coralicida]|uniref:hypothetical protein n=1 Tax=Aurantimonas coralicida TaxID=182270 RepID=UPI001E4BB555|nr:hypothetical protein [Aurantimonas coralicida]MCD1642393.1 hypothetical protein [Aurantimonas coralicida]
MVRLQPFTNQQRDLLVEFRSVWPRHVAALRHAEHFVGGMAFKTVNGGDYLVRYFPDPVTGKKRFVSLGRRTEDAERDLDRWTKDRDRFRKEAAASAAEVDHFGRMAKALRLARLPVKIADFFRRLSDLGLIGTDLAACGSTALYSYEIEAETLPTPILAADDRWDVELVSHLPVDALEDVLIELLGQRCRFAQIDKSILVAFGELTTVVHLVKDGDLADEANATMVVGRDGKPVYIPTVSYRDWLAIEARGPKQGERDRDRTQFVLDSMSIDWTHFRTMARIS